MRQSAIRLSLAAGVLLCLPVLLGGLARVPGDTGPAPASAPGPGGIWHRVAPDEDLRTIARRYYGSGREWRTLQLANDVGMQPPAGCELWIPAALPVGLQ